MARKYAVQLTTALLAVSLAVAGCSSSSGDSASGPVTIGVEIPLSPPGDVASGQLIQRGAQLAVQYINDNGGVLGGRKIQIAVQDTKGTPDTGVAGYRTLISSNHAVAVTGFFHSSVNVAVNEVAKELGVPTLSTQASASAITANHYDVAFSSMLVNPVRVAAWMEFFKKKDFKKIALIAEDTDYGTGLVTEVKQEANKVSGMQVNSTVFDHTASDFTSQLLKIQAWGPDLLLNIGVGQPMDLILDQAATIGLYPKVPMLISYPGPEGPDFWKLHPKDGVGVYYTGYQSTKQPLSDAGKWMTTHYKKSYNNEDPTFSTLNGFGDVLILAEAVDQAKSTDPKKVTNMLATGTFGTWTEGKATFPGSGGIFWHDWSPPVLILQFTKANQGWQQAQLVLEYTKGQS